MGVLCGREREVGIVIIIKAIGLISYNLIVMTIFQSDHCLQVRIFNTCTIPIACVWISLDLT